MAMDNEITSAAPYTGPLEIQHRDFDADLAVAQMEKRAVFLGKIKVASLNTLGNQDFHRLDGKPYLQGTGCEKLKPLWGIYFRDVTIEPSAAEIRRAIEDGRQVTVECMGTAGSRVTGEESVFIGTRSSDDKFFGGQQEKLGQMDAGHLRKAAYTNFEVNAITRLLGLRNLSWDEIQGAGHKQEGVGASVAYDRSGDGSSLSNKIWKMILDLTGGDENAGKDMLEEMSAFAGKEGNQVPGIRSFKGVGEPRLKVIYGKVKREWGKAYGQDD